MLSRAARDYYAILGVSRDADRDAIKKAFRSLAAAHHPDVSEAPDADDRFRELVEAYEVLSSAEARARYDRRGFARSGPTPRRRGTEPSPPRSPLDDFFDLVSPAPRAGERGGDVVVEVELAPEEARRGTTRGVRYVATTVCGLCAGRGSPVGSRWSTCTRCAGSGRLREPGRSASGRLIRLRACGRCRGLGRVVDDPCPLCEGRGRLDEERALLVRFAAGTADGEELRLEGYGHAGGLGGDSGDVVVGLSVPHAVDRPLLRRLALVAAALAIALLVAFLLLT